MRPHEDGGDEVEDPRGRARSGQTFPQASGQETAGLLEATEWLARCARVDSILRMHFPASRSLARLSVGDGVPDPVRSGRPVW